MHKSSLNTILAAIVLLFLVLGCGKSEPLKPIPISELCVPENSNQDVIVDGYVWAKNSIYCKKTASFTKLCALKLYDNRDQRGDSITVRFRQGNGSNELKKLPNPFTPSDIDIQTNDGKVVSVMNKIRVMGYATTKGKSEDFKRFGCFINVKKVESAE